MVRVLIRGIGDVGSAIAHQLFKAGFEVVMQDVPEPHYPRRGMAFTDAMFNVEDALLEGLRARRCDDVAVMVARLSYREIIPVTTQDVASMCHRVQPQILVDARMRKRFVPECQIHLAPLTIGIGPNFIAGETVDLVIESSWDGQLGSVIARGTALPLAGTVRKIAGYGVERVVYAPAGGVFMTSLEIGAKVEAGALVGRLAHIDLHAPLGGRLRGLTHNGVRVELGTKIIEVDPRENDAVVFGLGERPLHIAAGVVKAVRRFAVTGDADEMDYP
ncbi:MAG: hypothetical protein H7X91_00535 [Burkholderiales bacterium]|nr:hypothetical protein [Burkholderiales bacterium]